MSNIIQDLKWYGGTKQSQPTQENPSPEQLKAYGFEETGDTVEELNSYKPENALPEGRDNRVWAKDTPEGYINLMFVPTPDGWYVEDYGGAKWRPENLNELTSLMEEMDHQMERYGEFI